MIDARHVRCAAFGVVSSLLMGGFLRVGTPESNGPAKKASLARGEEGTEARVGARRYV